ncbi:preprotein translocase subunit SecE [Patescibacteria group bacterium]|nr:preprotein translocase subunit SecE [Patescibacteria group bacterium]
MPIISGVIQYLNEVRSEMLKVTWPSRNQTVKMTIIVLIVSVIVGILIGGLDLLLTRFFGVLIKR